MTKSELIKAIDDAWENHKYYPEAIYEEVYKAVDRALDIIEAKVAALSQEKASHYTLLANLAGNSIAELMINGTH